MSSPIKHATPDHPIDEILRRRYSPYAFDPRPVEDEKLVSCLEAVRWAASSFNEQPWRLILAKREDEAEFERALGCLVQANQTWAKNVGVLILTAVRATFTRNDKPNRVAEHDLGLAMANLTFQATLLGLHVHQMGGVDLDKVRQTYHVPEGYQPVTAVAIGYAAYPNAFADKDLARKDLTPRDRKPLAEFVFAGDWDQPAPGTR